MTEKELIEEIKNAPAGMLELDVACCHRIRKIANDYGENGETAKELLVIIRRLLEI